MNPAGLLRRCLLVTLLITPASSQVVHRFSVGVCTHFSQGKGLLPLNLSLIRQAGITSIRDEATWRTLERRQGQFDVPREYDAYVEAAVEAGLEPLIILDYGNPHYDGGDKPRSPEARRAFALYAEFLVSRYRGKVKRWEVWNEWDISIGGTTPGTAQDYVALLREVYPRIKKRAPEITVLGGSVTPGGVERGWLEQMLQAGALDFLDQVSIHTYNYGATGPERTPEAWAAWMLRVEDTLRKYNRGRDVPLAITEMGWPSQIDRRGTPPEVVAAYLARLYLAGAHDALSYRHLVVRLPGRWLGLAVQRAQLWFGAARRNAQACLVRPPGRGRGGLQRRVCRASSSLRPSGFHPAVPARRRGDLGPVEWSRRWRLPDHLAPLRHARWPGPVASCGARRAGTSLGSPRLG